MFAEHKKNVLESYRLLKASGPLSENLKLPAPAKLRDECGAIIERRFSKDDREILSSFFGHQDDLAGYVDAIEAIDIDLFKPLIRFMNGTVQNPHSKHVELLAWLIDYHPRPHRVKDMYHVPNGDQISPAVAIKKEDKKVEPKSAEFATTAAARKPSKNKNKMLLGILFLSITVLSFILFFKLRGIENEVQKCMYWNGAEFKPISCNEKPGDSDAQVIAKDSDKMINFKRDTRADTLTASSIGKIWYIKINGKVEYYTAPGAPPLYPDRRLLPLTAYILNKYPRNPG
ncbi:hypothetical protein FO440_22215 [Mucilaginibacter corticis]|uniref:Uncharacterized protein n=1 Tax=Mucilaginibacter corticis TaxID=2597670 RepID=A0A556M9F4_9SPHI|nr:hypothetical protein [Mucilaginibacter corticis]TSJ36547.1 hypothetical protein FO440_22215 [Mucilaginibacter corticis]